MKHLLRRIEEHVRVEWMSWRMAPHLFVVTWRQLRGRWYFFRDRPLWFVVTMADLPIEGGEGEVLTALVLEAGMELRRRLDQTLRGVEEIASGNEQLRAEIAAVREQLKKLGE